MESRGRRRTTGTQITRNYKHTSSLLVDFLNRKASLSVFLQENTSVMKEIEVKILEVPVADIKEKLEAAGAVVSFDDEMRAAFYDFEDGRIFASKGILRLRQEGPTAVLTRKELISKTEAKVMKETETAVEDPDALRNILQSLGLTPAKETHKHRIQDEWEGVHIVIDSYKGALAPIPPFLEIEAPDLDTLYRTVEKLGYTKEDCKSWDTGDLIKHYGLT